MKPDDPMAMPTGVALPLRLGLISLAYFGTQMLAFNFPDSFGLVAAIWPAAGIALAALLLNPRRHWPVLLGCFFAAGMAANLTTTRPLSASVGFMLANICETAASAWLITRLCGDQIRFARVREVLALMSAVIVINAATALIGAGAARLALGAEFWTFYETWWIADGLGLLLVTPLIVVWADSRCPLAGLGWGRRIEAAVMLALGGTVAWIIFGLERVPFAFEIRPYPLLVFVVWAALHYGLRGTATLLVALSVIAIGCTAAGLGHFPLGGADTPHRLLVVQVFLGVMGMTGLLLAAALAEQRDAQLRLSESEEQYRTVFESAADAIFIHDVAGQILAANLRAGEIYGYPPAELMSLSIARVDTPEETVQVPERIARVMTEGSTQFATHHQRKDGTTFAVEVSARRIAWQGQSAMMSICRDVSERKQAEVALRTAVREAEALLKEVHHRVKNNLQVITSLLHLESRRSQQPATQAVLTDMQGRIRTMALLHEALYRSGNFAAVDLGAYLRDIATQSFRMLDRQPGLVRLTLDLATVPIEMDQAVTCGLLVNELISNCLKHGFPAGRGGEVRIALQPVAGGPQVCLRVSDTGVGLPVDFAAQRGQSLGLQLVSDLSGQLNGTLAIGPEPQAVFALTFTPQAVKLPERPL